MEEEGLPGACVQIVQDTNRETANEMMRLNGYLDLLIPRGGAGLIQNVVQNSTVPVIQTGVGNCHVYVDESADLEKAVRIVINAKTQRPGVCNACESLLVHESLKDTFLPMIGKALQEKQVERIGGRKPIPIDIRVICATHKNIEQMVAEGTFREDLYYRLNIIPIELPPLRMRREDLPALITHYIGYYNQKLNKHLEGMEPEALDAMIAYDWPGNVRELKNIVEYLANIVEGTHVTLSDLPDHIALHGSRGAAPRSLDEMMSDYEKRILMRMVKPGASLEEKNHLADTLQVSRATLYRKLKKYDLI